MNKQEAIQTIQEMCKRYIFMLDEDKAIDMAIEALQDDWIPVSERLPEEYDQYLCYCEEGLFFVYWLENKPWAERTVADEGIIAWQPLPEPYKGGDTE